MWVWLPFRFVSCFTYTQNYRHNVTVIPFKPAVVVMDHQPVYRVKSGLQPPWPRLSESMRRLTKSCTLPDLMYKTVITFRGPLAEIHMTLCRNRLLSIYTCIFITSKGMYFCTLRVQFSAGVFSSVIFFLFCIK